MIKMLRPGNVVAPRRSSNRNTPVSNMEFEKRVAVLETRLAELQVRTKKIGEAVQGFLSCFSAISREGVQR